ncbi:MAG: GEVED domain-containing protein [Kiritimatiellae bacterium]|nr:GEVED domain-containing protein [Kiritimatiellia bacterium]
MPGPVLWWTNFAPGSFTSAIEMGDIKEGWYNPATTNWNPNGDTNCLRYEFPMDASWAFAQTGTVANPVIYWLDVQAMPIDETGLAAFGWKTTPPEHHRYDDACWAPATEPYNGFWWDLHYPPGHPYFELPNNSIDLAFALYGGAEQGETLDFGDAPDPAGGTAPGDYQTRLADNGASHFIVAGAPYFDDGTKTDAPDPEVDGQPDPNALGDDNGGAAPDDEDGIVINPLTVGQPGSVTITVDDGAGGGGAGGGYVDAWIDFNADGDWTDSGEKIVGGWLPQGVNAIAFTVPAGAAVGQTFARFRINSKSAGLLPTGGPAIDGEVEDHVAWIGGEENAPKWAQYPDLTPMGMDVEDMQTLPPYLLADDFQCTNRTAITNIVVWGSWFHDILPDTAGNVTLLVSFHADVPKGVHAPWSMPGEMLLLGVFPPGSFAVRREATGIEEGWYDPATSNWTGNADWTCWRYEFPVDTVGAFVQTGTVANPIVYWMDVQAVPDGTSGAKFGWKTSTNHWNDDACWVPAMEPYDDGFWWEMRYPPQHPYADQSIDLAFALFGGPEEIEELDFGDAPDLGVGNGPGDYNTLLVDFGARHRIVSGAPFLGMVPPDSEADGQPTKPADGDDINPPAGIDDEDGVTFPLAPLSIGNHDTINITVSAAAGAWLDGWIDWNQNGIWGDVPLENIVSISVPLSGVYPILVTPPPGVALAGQTYARFRVSTVGPLPPVGWLPDGEVEDYLVEVAEPDLGDAPDPLYPTLFASVGASHRITTGPWLGGAADGPDPEADGQPDASALGDDANGATPDDENGVTFATMVINHSTNITIEVSDNSGAGGGVVDAWIDWNADGDWLDAGEQIMTGVALPIGTNLVGVTVPPTASNGITFARFRISQQGGLLPTGPAPEGEVEDYVLNIESGDWGDAPDLTPVGVGYPTLSLNGGACHVVVPGYCLGAVIDAEPEGQPTFAANGDDNNPPAGIDDEDGVVFTSRLISGMTASCLVTASGAGQLAVWIDANLDTDWDDAGEQVIATNIPAGVTPLAFPVPALPGTTATNTYMRFRFCSAPIPSVRGLLPDGEVEDYRVSIDAYDPTEETDYGDAPEPPYPTFAPNGAAHLRDLNYTMGAFWDSERNGQPTPNADGDDLTGMSDDEDGVIFLTPLTRGSNATVRVQVSSAGFVSAWFDFNQNGSWADVGDNAIAVAAVTGGVNDLLAPVPAGAAVGTNFARVRYSSIPGPISYQGLLVNGEVEDYQVVVYQAVVSNSIAITNIVATQSVAQVWWRASNDTLTVMQTCSNLVSNVTAWVDATLPSASRDYTDTAATPTSRFYRVRAPFALP